MAQEEDKEMAPETKVGGTGQADTNVPSELHNIKDAIDGVHTAIRGPATHRVGLLNDDVRSELLNIKNQLNGMEKLLKQIHTLVMRPAA